MRFIHTADWQLGARFTQFGTKAELLRKARLQTLETALKKADESAVDAFLIAGDMFESNQVADKLVQEVFDVLQAHPGVRIIILPGNHDPVSGPGCIWLRKPFSEPSAHMTVCTSRDPIEFENVVILPVPITQKVSTRDPSLPLVEMAATFSRDKIKVGLTHGALAIEGKHQPNDQPIALNAATRARLDYLAIGHWHKPQVYDEGRLVMPGTPEPDQFELGSEAGKVVLAEIPSAGLQPQLEQISVATYAWHLATINLLGQVPDDSALTNALGTAIASAEKTVLRVELTGAASPDDLKALQTRIEGRTTACAVSQIVDRTTTVLSEHLWQAWLRERPLLAQAVADIERARLFTTGAAPTVKSEQLADLTLQEFQAICRSLSIEEGVLDKHDFDGMMGLIATEVSKAAEEGGAL